MLKRTGTFFLLLCVMAFMPRTASADSIDGSAGETIRSILHGTGRDDEPSGDQPRENAEPAVKEEDDSASTAGTNSRSLAAGEPSAQVRDKLDIVGEQLTPAFNVTVGTHLGYPMASFQYCVDGLYTVAVVPNYYHFLYKGLTSNLVGGLLTLNAYTDGNFSGFWGQVGGGAYYSSTTYGAVSGAQLALSGIATLGYRWRWTAFNLGLGAGAQYFDLETSNKVPLHTSVFLPMGVFDVGWAF